MCILHLVLLRGFGLWRRRRSYGMEAPRPAMCSTNCGASTPKISLVLELDYYSYLDRSSVAQRFLFYGTLEGSLPCLQYLSTELHLNPAETNPHSYIYLLICVYFRGIDVH
jgi:hypothetical protein